MGFFFLAEIFYHCHPPPLPPPHTQTHTASRTPGSQHNEVPLCLETVGLSEQTLFFLSLSLLRPNTLQFTFGREVASCKNFTLLWFRSHAQIYWFAQLVCIIREVLKIDRMNGSLPGFDGGWQIQVILRWCEAQKKWRCFWEKDGNQNAPS